MSFFLILKNSFRFFKEKFKEILIISLIFFLNIYLVSTYFSFFSCGRGNQCFQGLGLIFWPLLIGVYLFLTNILGELLILNIVKHPSFSFKEIFQESIRKLFPYLLLKIILLLILLPLWIAFLVPGLIYSIYLSMAIYCFVDQDLKIIESLKKSCQLVKGKWWKVFKIIIIFNLLIIPVAAFRFFVGVFSKNFILNILFNYLALLIGYFSLIFFYHLYFLLKNQDKSQELELTQ